MAPNRRHIVPNAQSGWDVKAPGAKRVSVHADTQAEAQAAARRILHNAGGGEMVTHNVKGQIRAADTVAPGNDPFPPKG